MPSRSAGQSCTTKPSKVWLGLQHGNCVTVRTVKNITVSVPDDVYRNARVAAARRDTSVSALVVAYLEQLSGRMDEFARLETLQREVQAGIGAVPRQLTG